MAVTAEKSVFMRPPRGVSAAVGILALTFSDKKWQPLRYEAVFQEVFTLITCICIKIVIQ
jgi:hypothetical protein